MTRAAHANHHETDQGAVAALRRVVAVRQKLESGEAIPPDLVGWLVQALGEIETGTDAAEALGLALEPGSESPHRILARERRNAWLVAALEATEGRTRWERAEAVAVAARDFMARRWPRWRTRAEPPGNATAQQRALYQAARAAEVAGLELPGNAKQFSRLAAAARGHEPHVFVSMPGRFTGT